MGGACRPRSGKFSTPSTGRLISVSTLVAGGISGSHPLLKDPSASGIRRPNPLVKGVAARVLDCKLAHSSKPGTEGKRHQAHRLASHSTPALLSPTNGKVGLPPGLPLDVASREKMIVKCREHLSYNQRRQKDLLDTRLKNQQSRAEAARVAEASR